MGMAPKPCQGIPAPKPEIGCHHYCAKKKKTKKKTGLQPAHSTPRGMGRWLHTQPSSSPSRDGPVSHFFPLKGNHWAQRRKADVRERWHMASQLETGMLLAHSTAQDCHGETWSHGNKLPDKRKVAPYSARTACWP